MNAGIQRAVNTNVRADSALASAVCPGDFSGGRPRGRSVGGASPARRTAGRQQATESPLRHALGPHQGGVTREDLVLVCGQTLTE